MINSLILLVCAFASLAYSVEEKVLMNADFDRTNENEIRLNGAYSGVGVLFFDDGKTVRMRGYFAKGMANGLFEVYDSKGSIQEIISRKDGLIHGPYIYYRSNGRIASVSFFHNGRRIGRQLTYDEITGSIKHNLETDADAHRNDTPPPPPPSK